MSFIGSSLSEMSYASQALLLVAALYRKGAITQQAKGSLKDLILQGDALVKSVVEAFFIDQDLSEVADSFTRVCAISGMLPIPLWIVLCVLRC